MKEGGGTRREGRKGVEAVSEFYMIILEVQDRLLRLFPPIPNYYTFLIH